MTPIILIPARLGSTRLPGKVLADIAGLPMIVHVLRRAQEAELGPVAVACGEAEVAEAVERAGGIAVLTDPDLPSGSDRIHAALQTLDPAGRHDVVINLQGDLPAIDPSYLAKVLRPLELGYDIGTLVAPVTSAEEALSPSVVKCVCAFPEGVEVAPALYFSRNAVPGGEGPLWHHIGIYAYRREALGQFVSLPPSALEQREKLEQLRALEAGMRIGVVRVPGAPFGVDTPADLEHARRLLGGAEK
ncbi:MAG: 3-deoxy-manno-octulosonate cytidylyltransferase [Acidocella sp.]|uniref:3-deoxy-manno-octulosonate cytidylyltransferase n=1 Tax=Acidocella sp. TaxID=50710 RepID=UPI003FC15595